jgi:nucleoside-diphosphate-sugar epimerase
VSETHPKSGENQQVKLPLPERYEGLRGKTMLLTGATGFIGGALFRRLNGYGLDVVGTVRLPEEAASLRDKGFRAEVLDLADDGSWHDLLRGVDTVFHIAAVFQEVECPRETYDRVNHKGAFKLVKTADRAGVERFVHCSTVGVYGDVLEVPATEESPFNPMDIYHETKLEGERAILAYAETLPEDGLVVTVNRPAMVYGPGDLRMFKLFKAVLSGKFAMIGSGRCLAHLGYIEDQVDSFLLGAVAPREKVHGEAFNIASDQPLTLNRLVEIIAEKGGVRRPRLRIPLGPVWLAAWLCEMAFKPLGVRPPLFRRRVGFFKYNRAFDLSKAKAAMGYLSRWSHEAGIQETIAWYREKGMI